MNRPPALLCLLLLAAPAGAQNPSMASGGPLRFEQAVFDVQSCDVSLWVDPATRSIRGTTLMVAKTVIPTNVVLLDLDAPYLVSRVTDGRGHDLKFERTTYAMRVWFPRSKQPGDEIRTSISYSGTPRVAPNAPWTGGFVWAQADGAPWVAVALQGEGADLLFPVKDHPSDKPSEATMRLTVPSPLVAVGPGRLQSVVKNADGTSTYDWRMTNPIPNYSIVFNAAPYRLVEDKAPSVAGGTIPIRFYVLPRDLDKAPRLISETKRYLAFYEKYLGPFPFRSQKLGIVETPHLGMEHSTAIAYGNGFRFDKDGLDWLLLHEFGHEWWANLVTAADWKDFWLHEGFQSYMDTLYQEHLHGRDAYLKAMRQRLGRIVNRQPVAPREPKMSYEVYNLEPDFVQDNPDIYDKGALILHALRYLIGDDAFFRSLRHMAYPTRAMERMTDGRQVRFATTDDYLHVAEAESGRELGWFFEVYLRQPKLPQLVSETAGNTLRLRWETPGGLPFPMPIDVEVDGQIRRVEIGSGGATVTFHGPPPVVDPKGWVLRKR